MRRNRPVLLRYKAPQRQAKSIGRKEENEKWERGGMRWQHGPGARID
jgi:hypothetical protein